MSLGKLRRFLQALDLGCCRFVGSRWQAFNGDVAALEQHVAKCQSWRNKNAMEQPTHELTDAPVACGCGFVCTQGLLAEQVQGQVFALHQWISFQLGHDFGGHNRVLTHTAVKAHPGARLFNLDTAAFGANAGRFMIHGVNSRKEEGTPIPAGRRWAPQRVAWKCSTAEWPRHMKDGSHPMKSRAPDQSGLTSMGCERGRAQDGRGNEGQSFVSCSTCRETGGAGFSNAGSTAGLITGSRASPEPPNSTQTARVSLVA